MEPFGEILSAKRQGIMRGVFSVCSSHPFVLEAALKRARDGNQVVLVEATANQVNQFGGYTGLKPDDFAGRLANMMQAMSVPEHRVVFGGDHLGPFPWRNEPAAQAMDKAEALVRGFVAAGAGKIHLDASMALGDDPSGQLDNEIITQRAVRLCAAAEDEYRKPVNAGHRRSAPVYVIGTEVPVPGGPSTTEAPLPTNPSDMKLTIEGHRQAFLDHGLAAAWERTIAVVVQPGIEYDSQYVYPYRRDLAEPLRKAILAMPAMLVEGHSTDYQSDTSLAQLVLDGIAILKVGPALTHAMRQAIFGLAMVEAELSRKNSKPEIIRLMEGSMRGEPRWWTGYTEATDRIGLLYGYSDRIRYYWDRPDIAMVIDRLFKALDTQAIPASLLSQFLPMIMEGLPRTPGDNTVSAKVLVLAAIEREMMRYEKACAGS